MQEINSTISLHGEPQKLAKLGIGENMKHLLWVIFAKNGRHENILKYDLTGVLILSQNKNI